MKKRYTIMLSKETIQLLKHIATKRSPSENREDIERLLYNYAINELKAIGKEFNFNDK